MNANKTAVRSIEDGPFGGTRVMAGDQLFGEMLAAPYRSEGDPWPTVRLTDATVAQTAHALSRSRLWLPGVANAMKLRMVPLADVGTMGLVDRDINGPAPRGPFDKANASDTSTYPALWNHNARKEKRIVCEPDSQLVVRQGMEPKAGQVWKTASRSHLNSEFTFGSQALAAAFTERPSVGGSAWPNVIFDDDRYDYYFAIWSNCTLGLVMHWWYSTRQQSSKARMKISVAPDLPIIDLRVLSDEQLLMAELIFEEFRNRELNPAYIADADHNRAVLDRRVVCDLLGFDFSVYESVRLLAAKWCAEPSVHGGKPRPKGAKLVINVEE